MHPVNSSGSHKCDVTSVTNIKENRNINFLLWGEGLVRLIGAVVCLLCCATGPLVRYRGQWMAAYRATVSSAHANQLPLPGL